MENNTICRDSVCRNPETEKSMYMLYLLVYIFKIILISGFLSEIVEILLYILLPEEDFQCKALRYVLREIFANCVILPLFNLMSDPDYINQAIIWLVKFLFYLF